MPWMWKTAVPKRCLFVCFTHCVESLFKMESEKALVNSDKTFRLWVLVTLTTLSTDFYTGPSATPGCLCLPQGLLRWYFTELEIGLSLNGVFLSLNCFLSQSKGLSWPPRASCNTSSSKLKSSRRQGSWLLWGLLAIFNYLINVLILFPWMFKAFEVMTLIIISQSFLNSQ